MNGVPLRIVDAPESGQGSVSADFPAPVLKLAFASLVRARALADAVTPLRAPGVAAVPPCDEIGDAVAVGAALASVPEDFLYPAPGDAITGWMRGMPPEVVAIQASRGGPSSRRMAGLVGSSESRVVPAIAGVGSRVLTALGSALAVRATTGAAVVCSLGARAAVRGSLATAWRTAVAVRAPLVILVRPGVSLPDEAGGADPGPPLAVETLRASTITVDGGDVLAVAAGCRSALEEARRGDGPAILVVAESEGSPLSRLEGFLRDRHGFAESELSAVAREAKAEVARAFAAAGDRSDPPDFESIFDDVLSVTPASLLEQRRLGSTGSTEYAP